MNGDETTDGADLRALLHETADGITPHGSLDEIKERIVTESNPRRWVLPTLAAAAAMVLVVGGVGWMLRDDDSGEAAPAVEPTPTVTENPLPQVSRDVTVYYVGDTASGPRLFGEKTVLRTDDADTAFALKAGQAALDGPPSDPDYRTTWPSDVAISGIGVSEDGKTIEVNLPVGTTLERPDGMSDDEARLALEQLVRSVQSGFGSPLGVRFYVDEQIDPDEMAPGPDGEPVQGTVTGVNPINHAFGLDTSEPVMAGDDDSVLAPVQIDNLTNGQKVPAGDLLVEGQAATFEANVVWELLVGGDAVAKSGFATAAECCTLSPYSFTIEDLQPGTYKLVVHDTDESGEGGAVNQDSKEIVVE